MRPAVDPVEENSEEANRAENKRRGPRAAILAQVEARAEKITVLGRARNIGLGGLLVESPDTLAAGTSVVVRFFLPPDRQAIVAAGRVLRVDPGQAMAISFLGLLAEQQEAIGGYVLATEGEAGDEPVPSLLPPEWPATTPQRRRSGRIRRHVPVILGWQDGAGHTLQESAETQLLSRHGGLVLTFADFKAGQLVHAGLPDGSREAIARVVMAQPSGTPGRMEMAFEFVGVEDFWGIEFPAPDPGASGEAVQLGQRRDPRLNRRYSIVLNWVDERGRAREEGAETRNLSRHGACLHVPAQVAPGLRLHVRVPELGCEADSRIIWARPSELAGRTDAGIEFVAVEDFWNLPALPR